MFNNGKNLLKWRYFFLRGGMVTTAKCCSWQVGKLSNSIAILLTIGTLIFCCVPSANGMTCSSAGLSASPEAVSSNLPSTTTLALVGPDSQVRDVVNSTSIGLQQNIQQKIYMLAPKEDREWLTDFAGKVNLDKESKLVKDYFKRTESANLDKLNDQLNKRGIVAITGIAGSGKTQLAYYYVYQYFREKHPNSLVATILCDTKETLEENYRQFASVYLGYNGQPNDPIDAIICYVKNQLNSQNRPYLLVFDSVDSLSYKDLLPYLPNCLSSENQQIIITSQNINFFGDQEQLFNIHGFYPREAQEFILTAFKDTRPDLKLEDAVELAAALDNLPLGLRCAVMYLTDPETKSAFDSTAGMAAVEYLQCFDQELQTIQEEIEHNLLAAKDPYQKSINQLAAIRLTIKHICKSKIFSEEEANYVLKCCSLFCADKIDLSAIKELFFTKFNNNSLIINSRKFQEILKKCKDYSLIQSEKPGFVSMYRTVKLAAKFQQSEQDLK